MPKLAIRRGDTFDREVDLAAVKDKPLKLGRGEQNDIVLPDPSKAVSRFHAELRREGARFVLEDRDSQNGLWVAGRRQPRVTLEPGVPVTVGSYTVMLVTSATERAGETAPADLPTMVGPRKPAQAAPASAPAGGPKPPASTQSARAAAPLRAAGGPNKTLVFGGFAAIVVLAVALLQVFKSADPSIRGGATTTTADASSSAPTTTPTTTVPQEVSTAPTTAQPTTVPASGGTTGATGSGQESSARGGTKTTASTEGVQRVARGETSSGGRSQTSPREREFADRYDRAKAALGREAYGEAIPLLNDLQRDSPGYRDVPMLLMQASNGIKTQAQTALTEAARLEQVGDAPGALAQYQRAQQIDPTMSGVVEPSVKRVRDRMKAEGVSALKDARLYDAYGQTAKAIPLYEKAYRYLSDDDPERKTAKDRLDALRAKK